MALIDPLAILESNPEDLALEGCPPEIDHDYSITISPPTGVDDLRKLRREHTRMVRNVERCEIPEKVERYFWLKRFVGIKGFPVTDGRTLSGGLRTEKGEWVNNFDPVFLEMAETKGQSPDEYFTWLRGAIWDKLWNAECRGWFIETSQELQSFRPTNANAPAVSVGDGEPDSAAEPGD